MQRIVVLNPKGGSGKTTIATNLAAQLASMGKQPTLLDLDPQGSSARWMSRRPADSAPMHCIAGFKQSLTATRSWQMRVPEASHAVVVDTPAAIEPSRLPDFTRGASAILVPVMPSEIDIHATAKCIADLLLIAKIKRSENRIGIIANRVRSNTLISRSLMRFLETLEIPVIATLRDTQHYVRSAELGIGIFEMPNWLVRRDLESWESLLAWLAARPTSPSSTVTSLPAPVLRDGDFRRAL